MIIPDFIVIGAMKCATSSLYEQLVLQPGISLSTPKEPNFFSDDDMYGLGIEWYEGLFAQQGKDDLLGEASTHYTKLPTYPKTVERIKVYAPNVKFIYVMRHPIDRLISHYMHEWSQGVIRCDINQALRQYSELIDYSRYHYQLLPYIEAFGIGRILPVFFESMLMRPQQEFERICRSIDYAGIPVWHDIVPQNASKNRIRRFPGYELLIENSMMRRFRRSLVPQSWRKAVKGCLSMEQRPVLNAENVAVLEQVFDDDLTKLGELMGKQLCCSTFKQVVEDDVLDWL